MKKSKQNLKIKDVNLANQESSYPTGRMPVLEIIYERFISSFRGHLSQTLKKPANVSIISTDVLKFGEFINTLPVPTTICITRVNELKGPSLFVYESKLVYSIIENLFGGGTRWYSKIEGKEFSSVELSFMRKIMDLTIKDMEEAFAPVHRIDMQYLRTEVKPYFVGVIPAKDYVVATTLEIEFGNSSGTMLVIFPYSVLKPIEDKLRSLPMS